MALNKHNNYLYLNWILDNQKEYDDYCALIDNLKAEALAYGFDYKVDGKEHRQKCRDKDITLLASNVTFMLAEKIIKGKEKPIEKIERV